MNDMPVETLLDVWYLKFGNKEVHFPLLVGANSEKIELEDPLMTLMW